MSNEVDQQSEPAQDISAFYYTAANHNILLESDIKTEIVEQVAVYPMPHAPAWCRGMISLRGKIIPVLDMGHLLKAESTSKERWLLVLESTPLPAIAVKIDSLPARLSYLEDQIKDITDEKQRHSWLSKLVKTKDLTLFKVDHNTLFQQLIDDNQAQQDTQSIDTNSQQNSSEDEV